MANVCTVVPTIVNAQARFRDAADRCLDFLDSRFDQHGRSRLDPARGGDHAKLPYVFNYGGRRRQAMRVLAHVARELTVSDGRYADESANGPAGTYIYHAGWLAWGSAALGRFDLAWLFARQLAAQQDQQLGGWWNSNEQGRVQRMLSMGGAFAGCAASGALAAAGAGARYLHRLLEGQPEPQHRFYYNLTEAGQVATAPTQDPTLGCYDFRGPVRPAHFAPVIAGLTWLGGQTGDESHLDMARRFADIMLRNPEAPASPFASKSGWAALLLHAVRPGDDLVAYAHGVGQAMLKRQRPDGSIDISDGPPLPADQFDSITISSTCDWTVTAIALGNGGG